MKNKKHNTKKEWMAKVVIIYEREKKKHNTKKKKTGWMRIMIHKGK